MKKLRIYIKTPYSIAIEVDGKELYCTGNHKDIASYCKRHFGIDLPAETKNYPTGTKSYLNIPKGGFTFDIE